MSYTRSMTALFIVIVIQTIIVIALLVFIYIIALYALPWKREIPYVPTSPHVVETMRELSGNVSGKRMCDLGCGDGRILIAFANRGAESHGYEFNPLLVLIARIRTRRARLQNRVFVHRKNFWREDLSSYDIMTIFGMPSRMDDISQLLQTRAKPGVLVLAHKFPIPGWQPLREMNGVYLYHCPPLFK